MPNRPKNRDQQGPGVETTPRYPETTPPLMPSSDYTYVLETVMRMQHDLGKLTEAVSGLKDRQVEQGKKLDTIAKQIYAAIVLIAVIGGVLGFFAKSINDVITNRLVAPPQQQASPSPTPTSTPLPSPQRTTR